MAVPHRHRVPFGEGAQATDMGLLRIPGRERPPSRVPSETGDVLRRPTRQLRPGIHVGG